MLLFVMLGNLGPLPRHAVVPALIATALMLAQCDRTGPEPVETQPVPAQPASPSSAPVATILGRADLLAATVQAASAYAAGERPEGADPLVGHRFAIRIPFGCSGPQPTSENAPADGLARWSWGTGNRTIQLTLTPADWTEAALVADGDKEAGQEAVEGFWIPRPWLTSTDCSSVAVDPLQAAATAPQTVGLAAVFDADDSRIGRRDGRAYAFTVRPTGEVPLTAPLGGYRLVLEGRLASFADGRAIRCRAGNPDQRPVCVAAIRLDRVAFTDADGGLVLSEWRAD